MGDQNFTATRENLEELFKDFIREIKTKSWERIEREKLFTLLFVACKFSKNSTGMITAGLEPVQNGYTKRTEEEIHKLAEKWGEVAIMNCSTWQELALALHNKKLVVLTENFKRNTELWINQNRKEIHPKVEVDRPLASKMIDPEAEIKALRNSVILEEIFKQLSFHDKKIFREVCKEWMEETLSYWRRTVWVTICHKDQRYIKWSNRNGLGMAAFNAFWHGTNSRAAGDENAGIYNLQRQPFRRLKLTVCYYEEKPGNIFEKEWEQDEIIFWKSIGTIVTHLKLQRYFNSTGISRRRRFVLILDIINKCPNLKELVVNDPYYQNHQNQFLPAGPFKTPIFVHKGTSNLQKLCLRKQIYDGLNWQEIKIIVRLAPNLKDLFISEGLDRFQISASKFQTSLVPLLSPVKNGKLIRLNKLKLESKYLNQEVYNSLQTYVELLPDAITHLDICRIHLQNDAREAPFHLYSAIAQTTQLKELRLEFLYGYDDDDETCDWFMDLSPFYFPYLTVLKLKLKPNRMYPFDPTANINFDFGTLKGMPQLEELEINFEFRSKSNSRRNGKGERDAMIDLIYEGRRDLLFPPGLHTNYIYSETDPVFCPKLKIFKFDIWKLQKNHVEMFSKWFPNVVEFNAPFCKEAVPCVLKAFPKLEILYFTKGSSLMPKDLLEIKRERAQLKIFCVLKGLGKMEVMQGRRFGQVCIEEVVDEAAEELWKCQIMNSDIDDDSESEISESSDSDG